MRPTLPSPRAGFSARALAPWLLSALAACAAPPPPVAPGPPIPAEPALVVGAMSAECGDLLGALDAWRRCPNLDEYDRAYVDAWRERAKLDFDAGEKAQPEAKAQHAIAVACHRGAASVRAATERCGNGKPPRTD